MRCDGCDRQFSADDVQFHSMFGHVMRYCAECTDIWVDFKAACEAEGQRVQRVLDLWEQDLRNRIPLRLTPLDMPRLVVQKDGQKIILG